MNGVRLISLHFNMYTYRNGYCLGAEFQDKIFEHLITKIQCLVCMILLASSSTSGPCCVGPSYSFGGGYHCDC